jgi:IclR family pca regulon transcriptional regulator
MTLTQVADQTGLTRAAARRILLTLQTLGYVVQEQRAFSLTARILDLGYSYLSSMPLARVAQPCMEDLVSRLDQSCSLAVLDGTDVVYILRVPRRSIMTTPGHTMIGFRLPAYVSSMGRVLLAQLRPEELRAYVASCDLRAYTRYTLSSRKALEEELAKCRQRGYSMVVDELEQGLAAVAVPILGSNDRAIAAMNLSRQSGGAARQDLIRKSLPELRKVATHLRALLAMHSPR